MLGNRFHNTKTRMPPISIAAPWHWPFAKGIVYNYITYRTQKSNGKPRQGKIKQYVSGSFFSAASTHTCCVSGGSVAAGNSKTPVIANHRRQQPATTTNAQYPRNEWQRFFFIVGIVGAAGLVLAAWCLTYLFILQFMTCHNGYF